MGFDIDLPWRELSRKDRNWLLFTDEQPVVPVYAGYEADEVRRAIKKKEEPSYQGTFTGAKRYVLHTFATTQSPLMKKRVSQYMIGSDCPTCHGKRLRREALSVRFAGLDIAEFSRLADEAAGSAVAAVCGWVGGAAEEVGGRRIRRRRLSRSGLRKISSRGWRCCCDLGLGYLTLERSTPTLSPGELQRLRLATQVRSNLFGVVYVLDEPSAGLHPADTEALLAALDGLKAAGNSLFVVEHDLDVIRHADWIVDVGPAAGEHGGEVLYSGPPDGLRRVKESVTQRYLFGSFVQPQREARSPKGWLKLRGVTRNNLTDLDVDFPLGLFTTVTGVSGSGKSSLVSQVLVELVAEHLGHDAELEEEESDKLAEALR